MKPLLVSWWSRVHRASRRLRVVEVVAAADEIPGRLPTNGAVMVGTIERPAWVAFDCPCVEHHRVMLNLDARRRPAWTVQSTKPLTLRPSIDEFRGNKRCHYFIRKGKVEWVRDMHIGGAR